MMEVDVPTDAMKLLNVYNTIRRSLGLYPQTEADAPALLDHVISASLPFLRCAAMLFRNMTDVPEPPALHGKRHSQVLLLWLRET